MRSPSSFPVVSETACLLKWGWSTLFLYSGKSNSCHRTTLTDVDPENIGAFHNTPGKLDQRKIMRSGGWPERGNGCEYCRDIEEAGGMSDRKTNLALIETDDEFKKLIPPELLVDPQALEVTPTMLEVYFTNRCNMSCIYCGPNYSTLWVAENKRFGTPEHLGSQISWQIAESLDQQYPARLSQFWNWMEKHSASLRMFHVLGGEPFYQSETEDAIRFWYDHPNQDVHFKVFSNLKVDKAKLEYLMGELKRLYDGRCCKSVGVIASLDCWGPEQEYVRSGLDLRSWAENFEYLITTHMWANISINSTINVLSIKTMPELLRRVRTWSDLRSRRADAAGAEQLSTVFNMLLGPPFMHAGILPAGFFDREFEEVVALLPRRNSWELANVAYMEGIWRTVNAAPYNPRLIAALKAFLEEMDRRRRSNWRATFPWLVEIS